jgi:hypothetical protein
MAERDLHERLEQRPGRGGAREIDPYRHQPDHRFFGYEDPDRGGRDWGRAASPGDDYRRELYGRYGFGPGDYAGRGVSGSAADAVTDYYGGETGGQIHPEHHVQVGDQRGRGPKGYRRSDARIQEDVSDWLTDDAWIDASDIEIRVESGEVTLAGTVNSRRARRRAEDIAERVSGVTYVQNNLRVSPPGSPEESRGGAQMAGDVARAGGMTGTTATASSRLSGTVSGDSEGSKDSGASPGRRTT